MLSEAHSIVEGHLFQPAQSSPTPTAWGRSPKVQLRQERNEIRSRLTTLTPDERSVLELIVDGIPNKMIAVKLDVGLRTVEARRRMILDKMSVRSISGLVRDVMIANDLERPRATDLPEFAGPS